MNEAKVFLYQVESDSQYNASERFDWEVTIALGASGNYFGKINGHGNVGLSGDNYPWTDTKVTDLEAAKAFMIKECDRKSRR
ncbi:MULTISPECIES: hypothetical protein [unclassified Paenibacillus]|uniref:hypothetical protein n=1 Tax=unclassified Paenibacillus TaxID=185978 RepID=UPI000407852B|nr:MULTISPECIES: hypothetical protein [unclassified Paenibacillus]KGP80094.1 hypothetical protein P364_0122095 [Paenibacillus sp. MAEPY2]KGP89405.1 hypothetical protein P363_0100195 [Paenibacillus sp. MAEPY1]